MSLRLKTGVESAIYTWIKSELIAINSSFSVIWSKPKRAETPAFRPVLPYAVLTVLTPPVPLSQKNSLVHKSDETWTHKRTFRFLMQVDIYVDDLSDFDYANTLMMSKGFARTIDTISKAGLAINTIGNPRDTTELISDSFEQRSTIDIEFLYEKTIDEAIGLIETVEESANLTYEGFMIT